MNTKKLLHHPITICLMIGTIAIISAFRPNTPNDGSGCTGASHKGLKDYGGKSIACGAPGEPGTCSQPTCHGAGAKIAGVADNAGPGSLVLTSVPAFSKSQYIPGQVYNMTVTVNQMGKPRMGFACEILDNSGNTVLTTNNTAGTLTCSDPAHTRIIFPWGTGRECIAQDSFGGFTANSYSFNFKWTAPGTGYKYDSVHIYVCGNATNNNSLADSGDFVYTKHIILTKGTATSIDNLNSNSFDLSVYPNPIHSQFTVSFNLPEESGGELLLYSLDGKLVRTFGDLRINAGNTLLTYPANDLAKGLYLLKVVAGTYTQTQKLIIE
jgi:hypothetical protein